MRTNSVFSRTLQYLIPLALLAYGLTAAQAQSTGVAGGTLSWTVTSQNSYCGEYHVPFEEFNFGSFIFAYGGTNYPIGGAAVYFTGGGGTSEGCPPDGPEPFDFTLPSGIGADSGCLVEFTAGAGGSGSALLTSTGCQATSILDPLYKVVSIIYDAPGNDSTNGFTSSTTDGTTTTIGSSITDASSMTFTEGFSFFGVGASASEGFGVSVSSSNSEAFTESFTDSTGVSNDNPGSGSNAINHGEDLFLIWMNPQITVVSSGTTPENYSVGIQPVANGKTPLPDILEIFANVMQANSSGVTTVPAEWLNQQTDYNTGELVPGLAAICKGLKTAEYAAGTCTLADQCGCVPSDFLPILADDPLIGQAGTTNPLTLDTSGATACGLPTPTGNCRYVPVPLSTGSSEQVVETLSGPESAGGNLICNSFTQSDSTAVSETLGGSLGQTVSVSFTEKAPGISLTESNSLTWTESQSTGKSSGTGSSQAVNLCSVTVGCGESIPIFEDTVFHTFLFSQPAGNTSCP